MARHKRHKRPPPKKRRRTASRRSNSAAYAGCRDGTVAEQPACIRAAVTITDPLALQTFYDELSPQERRHIDLWLITAAHPLANQPMGPFDRFSRIVAEEKAAADGA